MKQRTAAESAALDHAITERLKLNQPIKTIAHDLQEDESYVYTIMRRRLDVEKVLLFAHERTIIKAIRANPDLMKRVLDLSTAKPQSRRK